MTFGLEVRSHTFGLDSMTFSASLPCKMHWSNSPRKMESNICACEVKVLFSLKFYLY